MKCADCQLWQKSVKRHAGWRDGFGRCNNVPNFYDVTSPVPEFDPEDGLAGDLALKPEFKNVKACGLDSSGYQAFLITVQDFGCVSFTPKDKPESQPQSLLDSPNQ